MFPTSRIAAAALAALVTCAATAAEARQFHGSRGIHGPNGRGVTRTVDITSGGGQRLETRSLQTDRGRGITSQRQREVDEGSFVGSRTRTLNNGTHWGAATNATKNGNGTASYERTYTGPGGETLTRSGTVGRW